MATTPVSVFVNNNVLIKLAPLAAGTFVKPASTAFKTLNAAKDLQISFDDKSVDVSCYGSGFAEQNTKTSAMFKADLGGIVQSTDDAYKTILMPSGGNTDAAKANVFYEITAPNGDKFEGAAQISGLKLNLKLKDIYQYSFSLMGQGECTWTAFVPGP